MGKLSQFTNRRKEYLLLPQEKRKLFHEVLCETKHNSRMHICEACIQHGKTTVMKHCIDVAIVSLFLAYKYRVRVNERELIRGALLHDYFLYDWHENNWPNKIHGFTHPGKAMREACKDFELSEREKNMIKHHMFPLTPVPPKYREGVILCIADKICATKETIKRK